MPSWRPPDEVLDLKIDQGEAFDLRELLCQTARPNTLQSRLIQRIDALIEEARRPRHRR